MQDLWKNYQELRRTCLLCGMNCGGALLEVRETMLGTHEPFLEWRCSSCGSYNLVDPPTSLSRYYPSSYYSFKAGSGGQFLGRKLFVRLAYQGLTLRLVRTRIGGLICQNQILTTTAFILESGLDPKKSKLLDVGSGTGEMLGYLSSLGFRELVGIDAFIPDDIVRGDGVKVFRRTLAEVNETYDLVMFNHSFEHFPDPVETLRQTRRIMSPGGLCMIRVPVAGSFSANKFVNNWVQLDAPRHLVVPSEEGVRKAVLLAGMKLEHVWYDSGPFQFIGSERVLSRTKLTNKDREQPRRLVSSGLGVSVTKLRLKAAHLNNIGAGDQAAFLVRR